MAKSKKLPISIFEIIWYSICAGVILWGLTYVVLGIVTKFNDFQSLNEFNSNFKRLFGLNVYFWGLIIIAIAVVAAVVVLLFFARVFDRATEREQRRSARLNALKKNDEKVADEQQPEIVEAPQAE